MDVVWHDDCRVEVITLTIEVFECCEGEFAQLRVF